MSISFTNSACARIVPLLIVVLIIAILFEVYKSDFERWATPLTDWLREREAWSWLIPFVILLVLSFPPLFGHEVVQLVVGVSASPSIHRQDLVFFSLSI